MKRSAYESTEFEAARASSVSKYFNPVVGQHDEIKVAKTDKFGNPSGADFDLGKDGAFSQFKVLVGRFFGASVAYPENALKKKGFQVDIVDTEAEFVARLPEYDVAMFLSGIISLAWKTLSKEKFVNAIIEFHESGKGVWCWSDNDPLIEHSKAVLEHFSLTMDGDTPGNKTLNLSDNTDDPPTGHFKRHVITTGIKTLYEGMTISYLTNIGKNTKGKKAYPYAPFKVLAQSSDGYPVSAFLDNEFTDESAGRMLVDGGFTKLYVSWEDAGAARYVVNGVIWLLGLERKKNKDTKKKTAKKKTEGHWVWEWQNGDDWTLFHGEDAAMLEGKKEEGAKVFTTTELSFNAKFGTLYKFNIGAKKMTQTNTVSSRVTNVRRRPAKKSEKEIAVGKAAAAADDDDDDDEEEETASVMMMKKKSKKKHEEEDIEGPKAKKSKKKVEMEEDEDAPTKKMNKPGKWVWEWQKGKKWLLFAREDAEFLEEKLQIPKLNFKTRNMSFNPDHTALYVYDLENDTQKNSDTGTVTNIRRRKATAD